MIQFEDHIFSDGLIPPTSSLLIITWICSRHFFTLHHSKSPWNHHLGEYCWNCFQASRFGHHHHHHHHHHQTCASFSTRVKLGFESTTLDNVFCLALCIPVYLSTLLMSWKSLEVQRPLKDGFSPKTILLVGNLNHPKLGIILMVLDFEGIFQINTWVLLALDPCFFSNWCWRWKAQTYEAWVGL